MIDSDGEKAKVVRLEGQDAEDGALPYCVELWDATHPSVVEKMLGRASSVGLARAIFQAAGTEHPGRRITLRHGRRIVADS